MKSDDAPGPERTVPPEALASEQEALFGAMKLTPEEAILIRMSFMESDLGLRRCAYLLGGEELFLREAYLDPMLRWGASESFFALREHERALKISLLIRLMPMLGMPYGMWASKSSVKPSLKWRSFLWALLFANAPFSFFFALIFSQTLYWNHYIPAGVFFSMSVIFPFIFNALERRFIFKQYPALNPARWIMSAWVAPAPHVLEAVASKARDAYGLYANERHQCLGQALRGASFAPSWRLPSPSSLGETQLGILSLELLLALLRAQGHNPSTDAALAALAHQDLLALEASVDDPERAEGWASRPKRSL